jgi:hypothetical protein
LQLDGLPTTELTYCNKRKFPSRNKGTTHSCCQLDLQQAHVPIYFNQNVCGKDFERHRDVYVRKNPAASYNQYHGDTPIDSVGEGVGPTRTVSSDNSVQGKKRKGPG